MGDQEFVGSCPNKKSWSLASLLDLSQFSLLEQLKEKSGPHEKRHWNTTASVFSNNSPSSSPKWPTAIYPGNHQVGKWELTWIFGPGSEATDRLFPGPESTMVSSITIEKYAVQLWPRSSSLWVHWAHRPIQWSFPRTQMYNWNGHTWSITELL